MLPSGCITGAVYRTTYWSKLANPCIPSVRIRLLTQTASCTRFVYTAYSKYMSEPSSTTTHLLVTTRFSYGQPQVFCKWLIEQLGHRKLDTLLRPVEATVHAATLLSAFSIGFNSGYDAQLTREGDTSRRSAESRQSLPLNGEVSTASDSTAGS